MEDLSNLLDRIQALVDGRHDGAPERLLERMEHTLTDGYASALALEGEHLRIAREIGAAVAGPPRGAGARLAALAARLESTEDDLRRLRERLAPLRRKTELLAAGLAPARRARS